MNGEQVDPALLEEAAAGQADDEVEVVVRLGEGPPPPGLRIVSRLGPIATGRVDRENLLEVHEAEAVDSLKARRSFGPPRSPADELAAEAGDPDGEDEFEPEDLLPRHSRRDPARGVGSISAFCDWGPDVAHPDGRMPDGATRFLAIWDQRGRRGSAPGVGENRFGYGRIHDRDAINRALASGHPYDALGLHPGFAAPDGRGSHGMHTLSIAAGTPGEGRPGGVAPRADLVFVNLADHARGEGATLGNSVTLLEAVDFCLEVAAGRPLVCNFSMGRTADAHWGLSLLERAFDALLLAHDGLAFVNSGGNYHRARLHAATRLTPGARYDAGWELQPGQGGPHVLEAWYPWRDTLRFELRAPDGSLLADVPLGRRTEVRRDGRLWARVYNRYRDPNVPLNQAAVYVYGDAPAGTWIVSLIGEDVVDGQCDLWIDRTGVAGAQSRFRAEDAVATSTTGSICNGFHSIAVGAFDPHDADRGLASFSSGGPTGDGRMVPQVVAPGLRIVGARSAPPEPAGEPALLVAKSGTSEAAPFVAGLIACMYEVAGPLPIREVRRLLLQNTEPPPPASRGEEYRWGLGYLDIDAVLAATRRFAQHPPPGQSAPAAPVEPTPTRPLSATPSAIPVQRANLGKRTPMASDLAMPPIPLETAGEQENIAASTVWTVQDSQAWIRGGPPDFARDGTRTTPRGTRVLVLETQGTYARVATTGHADLGWTALSNLTTYYGRQPDLLSARLAPSQLITIDTSWPNERRELARAYNRLGGLLTLLATQARLEVSAILAVWQVESGGAPHVPGHAIIRFENHLFWRQWGHHDPERFDACFQFGGRPPMTDPSRCDAPFRCHRYRPPATSTDPTPAWRPVHLAGGSQDDEYAALRLAQDLAGDEPALTSISIGGPQILIANHARLGYDSAREMYEAFQASEAAQLLGFADFCEHDGAGGDTLQRLRDHDWPGFARRYNGTGQVTSYATRLESAYGQASQLFHPERTPATERLEPETDEAPRQIVGQLDPETDEAPPQTTAGDGEAGEALAGRGRDLPDPALTTAILAIGLDRLFSRQDPVVAGQPFDLGEGQTVEVVAAPRGYLASPVEADDLLVRQIWGEKPVVAVLDTNRLYDASTAASAAIPSESILPGRYATVRHNGGLRLRRLVDAEDRMPPRQALVRRTRSAWGEGDAAHVGSGGGSGFPATTPRHELGAHASGDADIIPGAFTPDGEENPDREEESLGLALEEPDKVRLDGWSGKDLMAEGLTAEEAPRVGLVPSDVVALRPTRATDVPSLPVESPGDLDESLAIPVPATPWLALPTLLPPEARMSAVQWNAQRHPARSQVDPGTIRARLGRYIDLGAIGQALTAAGVDPAAGASTIDNALCEAIHQFQLNTVVRGADGFAGRQTLDDLGLVGHGLQESHGPQGNVDGILKRHSTAVQQVTGGATTEAWWQGIVNGTFLGHPVQGGIHRVLMRRLRRAEAVVLGSPRFAGKTPVQVGLACGIRQSDDPSGWRPSPTDTNMHTLGLAIDVAPWGNPYVGGNAQASISNEAFSHAMQHAALLVSGEHLPTSFSMFLGGLGAAPDLDTAGTHRILTARDADLRTYLRLVNDDAALRARLVDTSRQPRAGVVEAGESLDAAAARWRALIATDASHLALDGSNFSPRDARNGFLNLPVELVTALRDRACLAWGAVDFGPWSGDMMHFDLRVDGIGGTLAQSTPAWIPSARNSNHLCARAAVRTEAERFEGEVVDSEMSPSSQDCPERSADEVSRSHSPEGILGIDFTFIESDKSITIQDFPVGSATLPAGLTTTSGWQRAMSFLVGDPTSIAVVTGYTDCVGSNPENLNLRKRRAEAVVAAMPPIAQTRVMWSSAATTTKDFLDTNLTPEGRAHNRAARVKYILDNGATPGAGISKAKNLDEFLYLVRGLERSLKLTKPSDAAKVLSVLRQIYYGSAPWTTKAGRNSLWDAVITKQPWLPATDPTPLLGTRLMQALIDSKTVDGIDMGHVLAGIDAMTAPSTVRVPGLITHSNLLNEAWATWAGDLGLATSDWAVDECYSSPKGNADYYIRRQASDEDLRGDIDSFGLRAGLNAIAGPAQLGQVARLGGSLSDTLLEYYRVNQSGLGKAHERRTRNFIEAYGGNVVGGQLQHRLNLEAALQPQIFEMAIRFTQFAVVSAHGGSFACAGNNPRHLYDLNLEKSKSITSRFVDWLLTNALTEPGP